MGKKYKLLLVDDQSCYADFVRGTVESRTLSWSVDWKRSGEEVLRLQE
jgi:hypothetical protein